MRTTVTLDPEIADRLRREMRRTGKSFEATLNEVLREGLARRRSAAGVPQFTVEARPLGVVLGFDHGDVAGLLEEAEGPGHR